MVELPDEFADLVRQIARVIRETGEYSGTMKRRTAEFHGISFYLALTEKPDLSMLVCPKSNWAVELETFDSKKPITFHLFGDENACYRDLVYIRMAVEA